MVMTDFSLPNRSTPWEGEVANSSIIYDFVRRGERPTVTLEDLSGLESENATKWMSLLQECWQQDPSKRPTSVEVDLKISSLQQQELGENSCICFQEWKSKNPNVLFTSLNIHQRMAIEVIDEVVSSSLRNRAHWKASPEKSGVPMMLCGRNDLGMRLQTLTANFGRFRSELTNSQTGVVKFRFASV